MSETSLLLCFGFCDAQRKDSHSTYDPSVCVGFSLKVAVSQGPRWLDTQDSVKDSKHRQLPGG